MGDSKIEWTDKTWNPVVGCSKVSDGCKNCYAERMAKRLAAVGQFDYRMTVDSHGWCNIISTREHKLTEPLHWRKPRKIFVCSMGDLFHESVPFEFIAEVWKTMAFCPQHTFQVLTKREKRLLEFIEWLRRNHTYEGHKLMFKGEDGAGYQYKPWLLPNVWLGVTAENQEMADKRIPLLLQTPAAKRFVSIEPMLSEIDLSTITNAQGACVGVLNKGENLSLDLVSCGGESGPGARPMHPDWARRLRDQCEAGGVPFYFKQWGEWLPEHQTEWSHCTMTERKTKDGEPIYELFDCNDNVIATGITEDIGANKGAWIRCGKKKAGHLLDGVEHRPEW